MPKSAKRKKVSLTGIDQSNNSNGTTRNRIVKLNETSNPGGSDTRRAAWINAAIFTVTLVVNGLGAAGFINGLSQKEISDRYITLITPSPATFSIWSVIYTFLLVSIAVMILKSEDPYYRAAVKEISSLFRISSVLNILWIVTFSFLLVELSVLFIFSFLVVLTMILSRLLKIQTGRRWLLPLTFGLYAGWLIIATVVNIASALVKIQWQGFGIAPATWSVAILLVGVVLASLIMFALHNAILPLPVAWAYFGIYQFLVSPVGFKGAYPTLQIVALVGSGLLIGAAAIQLYRNHWHPIPAGSAVKAV